MFKRSNSASVLIVALAITLGALLPFFISLTSGNLNIPHNDAWSYSRIASDFAKTGEIDLLGWNRATLVGQFLPFFGLFETIAVQQTFIAVCSIIFLLCAFTVMRKNIDAQLAAVGVLVISIWPGFGLLSTSFMSEIPVLSVSFFSLVIAQKAYELRQVEVLVLSLIVAFWAFTIKESGLAAVVAILIFSIRHQIDEKIWPKYLISFLTIITGIALMFFYLWRSSLAGSDPAIFSFRQNGLLVLLNGFMRFTFEFGLIATPVLIALKVIHVAVNKRLIIFVSMSSLGIFQLIRSGQNEFYLPNYFSKNGSYPEVLPPVSPILNEQIWLVIILTSIVFASLLSFIEIPRSPRLSLLNIFTILTIFGVALQFLVQQGVFSRYFIAILPGVFVGIFKNAKIDKSRMRTSVLLLVPAMALSYALMLNAFAFDSARWKVGQSLVESGVPSYKIDAGLEWNGFHSENGVIKTNQISLEKLNTGNWVEMFNVQPCYVVSKSRNFRTIDQIQNSKDVLISANYPYKTFLYLGHSELYIYRTQSPGC
jgi:hypothetical protein